MKEEEKNTEEEPSPVYHASRGMGIALNVLCIFLIINLVVVLIFIGIKIAAL